MAWPDSHDVLGDADQTIYYDPDHGGTSSGTSANPYKTMAECIAAFTYTDFTVGAGSGWKVAIKCRAGTETNSTTGTAAIDLLSHTFDSTYYLVIEPDTGHEPIGTEPQIAIETTSNVTYLFRSRQYCVVDGIRFKNGYTAASRVAARIQGAGPASFRNCMFEGDYAANTVGEGLSVSYSNGGGFIENCLFFDCDIGLGLDSTRTDPDVRSCTFADCNEALDAGANAAGIAGTKTILTGCLFYNNTSMGDATYIPSYFESGSGYNATTDVSDPSWTNVGNWVTSVSTSDGVDVESPSTDDFRAASGGSLDGGDLSTSAPAEDMFGTVRPQGANDDVGYYEIASGATIAPLAGRHLQNMMSS